MSLKVIITTFLLVATHVVVAQPLTCSGCANGSSGVCKRQNGMCTDLNRNGECPLRSTLCSTDLFSTLLLRVETLENQVDCMNQSTYEVNAASGELIKTDCNGSSTTLGSVLGPPGATGADGASCSISSIANGASITCGSQAVSIFNGQNGLAGTDGLDGNDGVGCTIMEVDDHAVITCGSDSVVLHSGQDGAPGTNGVNGVNGVDGADGADGVGCTIQNTPTGAMITCGVASTAVEIFDGQAGLDGDDGIPGEGCTVSDLLVNGVSTGAEITCAGVTVPVLNGRDGQDGTSCTNCDGNDTPPDGTDTGGDGTDTGGDGTDTTDGADGTDGMGCVGEACDDNGADDLRLANLTASVQQIEASVQHMESFLGAIYPSGFESAEKQYFLIEEKLTWESGRDACRKFPGFDLARIETDEENQRAREICKGVYLCWIGLNDIDRDGVLQWADGTAVFDTSSSPDFSNFVSVDDGTMYSDPFTKIDPTADFSWSHWFDIAPGDTNPLGPSGDYNDVVSLEGIWDLRGGGGFGSWTFEDSSYVERYPICSTQNK